MLFSEQGQRLEPASVQADARFGIEPIESIGLDHRRRRVDRLRHRQDAQGQLERLDAPLLERRLEVRLIVIPDFQVPTGALQVFREGPKFPNASCKQALQAEASKEDHDVKGPVVLLPLVLRL